jgi:magnesium chelatase subunit D
MGRGAADHAPARSGRYVRAAAVKAGERAFDIAVDATLRAALIRPDRRGDADAFGISPADLRKKVFRRRCRSLVVFVVDASDSMGQGTLARMKAAKGAVLAFLAKTRKQRHRMAMVAFMKKSAEVVLQPTTSLALARNRLESLPTGGATPFADGLMKAWRVVKSERLKDPRIRPLLVVISDGEANVPYAKQNAARIMAELEQIAGRIGRDGVHAVVIDTRSRMKGSERMRRVARAFGGAYHHIDRLKANNVLAFVAKWIPKTSQSKAAPN